MSFDAPFARFPDELNLPDADPSLFQHAKEAVRQEYRESTRWKRLQCRAVKPLESDSAEPLFVIEVGHAIEFDWTWEGATAFRPPDMHEFGSSLDVADGILRTFNEAEDAANSAVWKAEIVEVDETRGRIDEVESLLDSFGASKNDEVRRWLTKLWNQFEIQQEPIIAPDGEIIAEPTFWFRKGDKTLACFAKKPGTAILYRLEDAGIEILEVGAGTE